MVKSCSTKLESYIFKFFSAMYTVGDDAEFFEWCVYYNKTHQLKYSENFDFTLARKFREFRIFYFRSVRVSFNKTREYRFQNFPLWRLI